MSPCLRCLRLCCWQWLCLKVAASLEMCSKLRKPLQPIMRSQAATPCLSLMISSCVRHVAALSTRKASSSIKCSCQGQTRYLKGVVSQPPVPARELSDQTSGASREDGTEVAGGAASGSVLAQDAPYLASTGRIAVDHVDAWELDSSRFNQTWEFLFAFWDLDLVYADVHTYPQKRSLHNTPSIPQNLKVLVW